jgi:hypothetical protein
MVDLQFRISPLIYELNQLRLGPTLSINLADIVFIELAKPLFRVTIPRYLLSEF